MGRKSEYLQIRVSPEQKAAISRAASRAGKGMSAFVLSRLLPPTGLRFRELLAAMRDEAERRYALAELNDLLTGLGPAELPQAVAEPPPANLSDYLLNYVAAMVEMAAYQKGVAPPGWVAEVEPLAQPHFAASLPGLRLHLLAAAPVPFRRRNIFVDSAIGDRI